MDVSMVLDYWLFGLGIIFVVSSVALITVNKRQRDALLNRFDLHRRRAAGASTPPRSFSPSRKSSLSITPNPDYYSTFPPSRRSVLPQLAEKASPSNSTILSGPEPPLDFLLRDPLPTTRSYNIENDVPKYTPTGFSTAEIKAIGDFPAYDVLSGVPLPEPYEEFDPSKALPRPYRPFRWAYHQTMCRLHLPFIFDLVIDKIAAFTKMEPNWWLELENNYVSRVKERQELFRDHGSKVLDYLPGSELVCKELMEMCLQFYCARYPSYFSLSADSKNFHNRILGTDTEIKRFHPLHILLNNVPEDFAIVLRNEDDGMYYFRAGVICSSLGWNVGTKIGMQLKDIHAPIPDYKEKMAFSMDRYFSKMPTNAPIQRGSWGLEVGTPLFMPPGHPHEKLREIQKPDLAIEECHLRVDWQTLRRLPLSGGIVFNFKALFTPVQEFRDEPYIPALLLKILKEGKKNLMEYKNTWHVEHVCLPELEEYDREQVAKGLVKPDNADEKTWNVATLAESPYFPGWEEKWHRQQGF
jgi:hypothetical protein